MLWLRRTTGLWKEMPPGFVILQDKCAYLFQISSWNLPDHLKQVWNTNSFNACSSLIQYFKKPVLSVLALRVEFIYAWAGWEQTLSDRTDSSRLLNSYSIASNYTQRYGGLWWFSPGGFNSFCKGLLPWRYKIQMHLLQRSLQPLDHCEWHSQFVSSCILKVTLPPCIFLLQIRTTEIWFPWLCWYYIDIGPL